jgi:hypothetical protein
MATQQQNRAARRARQSLQRMGAAVSRGDVGAPLPASVKSKTNAWDTHKLMRAENTGRTIDGITPAEATAELDKRDAGR